MFADGAKRTEGAFRRPMTLFGALACRHAVAALSESEDGACTANRSLARTNTAGPAA